MKFTVMYKDCDKVVEKFHEYCKTGYGVGVRLMELRHYDIKNVATGKIVNGCLGYCCKGSRLAYLWHKLRYGKFTAVVKGW